MPLHGGEPPVDYGLAGELDAGRRRGDRPSWPASSRVVTGKHGDDLHAAPLRCAERRGRRRIGKAEENAPDTWRFSIDVAKSWEQAAAEAATPHTRKALLRSAIILGPDRGGAFDTLLRLVAWAGRQRGDGRQYVSWIHDQDFVRSVYWLIDHAELDGPVNLASPNPVPNAEFMRTLAPPGEPGSDCPPRSG